MDSARCERERDSTTEKHSCSLSVSKSGQRALSRDLHKRSVCFPLLLFLRPIFTLWQSQRASLSPRSTLPPRLIPHIPTHDQRHALDDTRTPHLALSQNTHTHKHTSTNTSMAWLEGEEVLARDKSNTWYPGKVVGVQGSRVTVHFDGWSRSVYTAQRAFLHTYTNLQTHPSPVDLTGETTAYLRAIRTTSGTEPRACPRYEAGERERGRRLRERRPSCTLCCFASHRMASPYPLLNQATATRPTKSLPPAPPLT